MTPKEIKKAMEDLGVSSNAEMARILETPYRTYQDWTLGTSKPPAMLATVFKLLLIIKKEGLCLKDI